MNTEAVWLFVALIAMLILLINCFNQ